MRTIGFFMMGALLAGCSGFDDLPSDVCKKQHVEETSDGEIVVCDELYPEAPYVHLPESTSEHAYAGIVNGRFRTADGKSYSGVDASGEARRHGVALYELVLDDDSVEDYRSVITFKESFFLAPLFGRAAEGVIARRVGTAEFASEASLPVRVEFHTEKAAEPKSGNSVEVVAEIANLDQAVTASDGSCLPPLSSYGEESTYDAGTSVELRGFRVPSMHHDGDDQFVFLLLVNGEDRGTMMSPVLPGSSEYGSSSAAPRDPSAPSATTFTHRTVSRPSP